MQMKVFEGTYHEIEDNFNKFFEKKHGAYIQQAYWRNDVSGYGTTVCKHMLFVVYTTD